MFQNINTLIQTFNEQDFEQKETHYTRATLPETFYLTKYEVSSNFTRKEACRITRNVFLASSLTVATVGIVFTLVLGKIGLISVLVYGAATTVTLGFAFFAHKKVNHYNDLILIDTNAKLSGKEIKEIFDKEIENLKLCQKYAEEQLQAAKQRVEEMQSLNSAILISMNELRETEVESNS